MIFTFHFYRADAGTIFLTTKKKLSYAWLAQNFNCRLWSIQMGWRLSWYHRSICNNLLGVRTLLIKYRCLLLL